MKPGIVAVFAVFVLSLPWCSDDIDRRPITDLPADTVTYQTEDGVRIVAGWFVPDEPKPAAVILLHEQDGTRAQWNELIPVLVDNGYAVLAPDIRGFGESTTIVRDGKEEAFQFTAAVDAILDVSAAMRFLQESGVADMSRGVGVIGSRMGGALAYVSTGVYTNMRAGVAITPPRFSLDDPLLALIPDYCAHDVFYMAGGEKQWEDAVSLGVRTEYTRPAGSRRYIDTPDLEGIALLTGDEPIRDIVDWLDSHLTPEAASPTPRGPCSIPRPAETPPP